MALSELELALELELELDELLALDDELVALEEVEPAELDDDDVDVELGVELDAELGDDGADVLCVVGVSEGLDAEVDAGLVATVAGAGGVDVVLDPPRVRSQAPVNAKTASTMTRTGATHSGRRERPRTGAAPVDS